ncbi:MAG TPA: Y4yA family PLP-dependent enzyme [Pseudonocardia sp.]|nr:Y4yA family PLP-dependent enzyme [Pseudonocardia sp.]
MELTSRSSGAGVADRPARPERRRESAVSGLPALEPEWAREVRADPGLLATLAHGLQGPFHVLFPDQFAANLAAFRNALTTAGVAGQVYYGKKANKSGCWLPVCAVAGAGVDVASVPELVHALSRGVRGEDMVVTGAAKSDELLWLAARHGCLLAIDALDELARVVGLVRTATGSAPAPRLLLRVLPEVNPASRFGLTSQETDRALGVCARERLDLRGFSFHLNGYDPAPRAEMAYRLVGRCLEARRLGLAADSVDIGGGFACAYVSESDWTHFTENYRADWFHADKTFTHFYPYHQSPIGADMLSAILHDRHDRSESLSELLIRTRTRLLLEPGRALLDGAGFTVFPVQGYKERDGYGIVTVDGLSGSVSEQWKGSEYLPDPILWPASRARTSPVRACVGGASCMDYDMLTWRKVAFDRRPEAGDLLVYPNTAGYQMDKNETEFHQLRLPRRVVLTRHDRGFRWRLDDARQVHRTGEA